MDRKIKVKNIDEILDLANGNEKVLIIFPSQGNKQQIEFSAHIALHFETFYLISLISLGRIFKEDVVINPTEKVSNCCYARVDNGRCSACKDNCEEIEEEFEEVEPVNFSN